MTFIRFNLSAALAAPAVAALLAASAQAATDEIKGDALLHEVERDSSIRSMSPTPYVIEDKVIVVGPTMDHEVYERHGGERITANYEEWPFETERRIIEIVQSVYGEDAPHASGGDLPRSVATQLNVGATLPEDAETQEIAGELKEQLPEGVDWVAVGEHLIAMDSYGRIAHVYWDMLPRM